MICLQEVVGVLNLLVLRFLFRLRDLGSRGVLFLENLKEQQGFCFWTISKELPDFYYYYMLQNGEHQLGFS
jgi:hypothetical protein